MQWIIVRSVDCSSLKGRLKAMQWIIVRSARQGNAWIIELTVVAGG